MIVNSRAVLGFNAAVKLRVRLNQMLETRIERWMIDIIRSDRESVLKGNLS